MTESASASHAGSILVINGGSSTLKFALFRIGTAPVRELAGSFDRIGSPEATLRWAPEGAGTIGPRSVDAPNHAACLDLLLACIADRLRHCPVVAIGHRVVHGGQHYRAPQPLTPAVMDELQRLSSSDPEHLPGEIELIQWFAQRYPHLPQVACFDTTFHRDMPRVTRLFSIPRRYEKLGLQRYGFHGLSYAFLMRELERVGAPHEVSGRVIMAHLGNGASMAAVKHGKAVDTTMSFTPASGLVMSRRSGDLDPGLISYLARTEGMTVEQFHRMVNTESGLLGVSEISADMRDLLKQEQDDPRAAEAIELFCYQARKWIGALVATLGGVDTVVFTAGIGAHSPIIRARICAGLEFLGIAIDSARNEADEAVISSEGSRVTVRVIRTDEESEIARSVLEMIGTES
ncbi:MAG: acetate/propionate family kinase [Nitrospiraceae bacterium]